MSTSDMHELAERLARGDEAAFAELYDACADRLHHYVALRTGSPHAAADVLQIAFMRAVKSRKRFRGVENPIAYMFQIVRNEAARALKRPGPPVRAFVADEDFSAGSQSCQSDDREIVEATLGRLTVDDRELVELKIFGGLSFREIADVTGQPQGTVATQYRRAMESLRPWLAKQLR